MRAQGFRAQGLASTKFRFKVLGAEDSWVWGSSRRSLKLGGFIGLGRAAGHIEAER